MKRVLLAWELGGGTGYTGWLLAIARALQAEGFAVTLALREPVTSIHQYASLDAPMLAAPVAPPRKLKAITGRGFHPSGFADLMLANGFGETHVLHALVRAWRGLIDLARPDLIVGAYSPVLGLAAYGRVPLALIGYGYTLPPADKPQFPLFRDDRKPYADQHQLLERVRRVQGALKSPLPEKLTDIYRGDARFILSFPEIDPYQAQRREAVVGALEDLGPVPRLPAAARFYAYLVGDQPFLPSLIEGLASCGLPGSIYLRDSEMKLPEGLDAAGIDLLKHPPPLDEAIAGASLVIHHGGANTLHAALGAARPQILVPRNLDQTILARQAVDFRIASRLDKSSAGEAVRDTLWQLLSDRALLKNLDAYARLIRARGQHNALPAVVARCLSLLD